MLTENSHTKEKIVPPSFEELFNERFQDGLGELSNLYNKVYATHPENKKGFDQLLETIATAFDVRTEELRQRDI